MKKAVVTLLACLLAAALCCVAIPVAAVEVTVIFKYGSETVDVLNPVDDKITLPEAPDVAEGEAFVGWYAEEDGEKIFLPAGAEYMPKESMIMTAYTVHMKTNEGASFRIVEGGAALRFTSSISIEDYDALVALVGKDNLQFGTYIVASSYLASRDFYDRPEFTLESLAARGYTTYIDVPTDGWYTVEKETYTFAGSVANILPGNYSRSYSGIGYVKVHFGNGVVGTAYCQYHPKQHSRNIYEVAFAAYEDRRVEYPNLILENDLSTHSQYTREQLDIIRGFLDQVVAFDYTIEHTEYVFRMRKGNYYKSSATLSVESDKYGNYTVTVTLPDGVTVDQIKGLLVSGYYAAYPSKNIVTDENHFYYRISEYSPAY